MSHQTRACYAHPTASPAPVDGSVNGAILPVWITSSLLGLASLVLLGLACASAWLSYHAQVAYVLAHNGDQAAQARVWALLLDAGTAGVSLLRLYETLRGRPGLATRASLLGCIAASVAMNLLHTPIRTPGGYLVASVPPVMYAVFLEHLLANLRSVLIADEKQRTPWRTLAMWINFPGLMWSARRSALRGAAEAESISQEPDVHAVNDSLCVGDGGIGEVEQFGGFADGADAEQPGRSRRGRGPGAKRIAFEAALVQQMHSGDLRLFSDDERERNAAAYRAAASLPVPLSRGAARRYVVQALPRMEQAGAFVDHLRPDSAAGAA